MNKASVEAGLTLCKELGVISDWKYDPPTNRYELIKKVWDKNKLDPDLIKSYLTNELTSQFKSPTDLSDAVKDVISNSIKQLQIEDMVKDKLNKLLKRIETTTTKEKGLVGPDMGWVKIRLDKINKGEKLTKNDLIHANEMWKRYEH